MNAPAYPIRIDADTVVMGLTKREAFAAAALPSVLMLCSAHGNWENLTVVRRCYELADDMLTGGGEPFPVDQLHECLERFRSEP